MSTVLMRDQVTVRSDGSISLPEHIRAAGVLAGDTLAVWWLPPDEIILRKLKPGAEYKQEFDNAMAEFRVALASAGYDTQEKINTLVRQIKEEQAREWTQSTPSE